MSDPSTSQRSPLNSPVSGSKLGMGKKLLLGLGSMPEGQLVQRRKRRQAAGSRREQSKTFGRFSHQVRWHPELSHREAGQLQPMYAESHHKLLHLLAGITRRSLEFAWCLFELQATIGLQDKARRPRNKRNGDEQIKATVCALFSMTCGKSAALENVTSAFHLYQHWDLSHLLTGGPSS